MKITLSQAHPNKLIIATVEGETYEVQLPANTSYESCHLHGNLQLECEYSLPKKYPMNTLVRTG